MSDKSLRQSLSRASGRIFNYARFQDFLAQYDKYFSGSFRVSLSSLSDRRTGGSFALRGARFD